jgi:hypothetical protein
MQRQELNGVEVVSVSRDQFKTLSLQYPTVLMKQRPAPTGDFSEEAILRARYPSMF